jgi:hypothetical protein
VSKLQSDHIVKSLTPCRFEQLTSATPNIEQRRRRLPRSLFDVLNEPTKPCDSAAFIMTTNGIMSLEVFRRVAVQLLRSARVGKRVGKHELTGLTLDNARGHPKAIAMPLPTSVSDQSLNRAPTGRTRSFTEFELMSD